MSQVPASKKALGLALQCSGLLLGITLAAGLVFDARSGANGLLAAPMNLVVGGAVCILLWRGGLSLRKPDTHGASARRIQQYRELLAAQANTLETANPNSDCAGCYRALDDDALYGVFMTIDRDLVPERFGEFLLEVQRRLEADAPSSRARPEQTDE